MKRISLITAVYVVVLMSARVICVRASDIETTAGHRTVTTEKSVASVGHNIGQQSHGGDISGEQNLSFTQHMSTYAHKIYSTLKKHSATLAIAGAVTASAAWQLFKKKQNDTHEGSASNNTQKNGQARIRAGGGSSKQVQQIRNRNTKNHGNRSNAIVEGTTQHISDNRTGQDKKFDGMPGERGQTHRDQHSAARESQDTQNRYTQSRHDQVGADGSVKTRTYHDMSGQAKTGTSRAGRESRHNTKNRYTPKTVHGAPSGEGQVRYILDDHDGSQRAAIDEQNRQIQQEIEKKLNQFRFRSLLTGDDWKGHEQEIRDAVKLPGVDINAAVFPYDQTELHAAVKNTEEHGIEKAALLLELKANVNARDASNQTPLHNAALYEFCEQYAPLLVQEGADINARDSYDYTALHYAALRGQVELVTLLLQQDTIDVNGKHKTDTPLTLCISKIISIAKRQNKEFVQGMIAPYCDIIEMLCQHSDIDLHVQVDGYSLWDYAFKYGTQEMAQKMLRAGVKHTDKDRFNHTSPLYAGARVPTDIQKSYKTGGFGMSKDDCISALVQTWNIHKDEHIREGQDQGRGVAGSVKSEKDGKDCKDDKKKLVLRREQSENQRLFFEAVRASNDINVVNVALHKESVDINEPDIITLNRGFSQETALHYAVDAGHKEVASFLIQMGAKIDAVDRSGDTPLHYAAQLKEGAVAMVKMLLNWGTGSGTGSKLNITGIANRHGDTALTYANNKEVADMLRQNMQLQDLLVQGGMRPCKKVEQHVNQLLFFAEVMKEGASIESLKQILQMPHVDINEQDESGYTALHKAVLLGDAAIVTFLVEQKADVNACDAYGMSPLQCTSFLTTEADLSDEDIKKTVKALLKGKASLELKDKRGQTALCYARDANNKIVCQLLEEAQVQEAVRIVQAQSRSEGELDMELGMQPGAQEDAEPLSTPEAIDSSEILTLEQEQFS